MASVFELKSFGAPEVMKMFARLPEDVQNKLFPPIVRRSMVRVQEEVGRAWASGDVKERTGRSARAFRKVKPKKLRIGSGKDVFMYATEFPPRDDLGIDPKDRWYYPMAIEYGSPHIAARAPIRNTVNRVQDAEFARIGKEIGDALIKRAAKLGKATGRAR